MANLQRVEEDEITLDNVKLDAVKADFVKKQVKITLVLALTNETLAMRDRLAFMAFDKTLLTVQLKSYQLRLPEPEKERT